MYYLFIIYIITVFYILHEVVNYETYDSYDENAKVDKYNHNKIRIRFLWPFHSAFKYFPLPWSRLSTSALWDEDISHRLVS